MLIVSDANQSMRVLFYGTPEFALPTFEALLADHEVVAAVTQPDKPAGRGQQVMPSAIKRRAEAAGIPVVQPPRLRDPEWPGRLAEFRAEVAVVVAFGQILPKAVLDVPARGSINVHASILPRLRGAAPIAWAIIRGETETGHHDLSDGSRDGHGRGPPSARRRRSPKMRRPESSRRGSRRSGRA